jgi:hypothetical protein
LGQKTTNDQGEVRNYRRRIENVFVISFRVVVNFEALPLLAGGSGIVLLDFAGWIR